MEQHRARMDRDYKPLLKLANRLDKQDVFVLEGPEYARKKQAPHPKLTDWYNKKSLSIGCTRPLDEGLYSPALVDTLVDGFTFLMPYYELLLNLVGGWGDPWTALTSSCFSLTYQEAPPIPRRGFLIYGHRILWAWRVTWQPRFTAQGNPAMWVPQV